MTTTLPSTAESRPLVRSPLRPRAPVVLTPKRTPLSAEEFWKRLGA